MDQTAQADECRRGSSRRSDDVKRRRDTSRRRATRRGAMVTARSTTADVARKPFYAHLYVQVLTAIVIGVLLGHFYPHIGEAMRPFGDAFIKMIKMLIAPIIFCTVVHGIASMDIQIGRAHV